VLPSQNPVQYGFEPEDVKQEAALGRLQAEVTKPGDAWAAESRAAIRVGRHRKKERAWAQLRIPILDHDKVTEDIQYQQTLAHEILDLLPYATKDEVLTALLEGDGRNIRKAVRRIKEELPGIDRE
jgi:hypothetical protein